MRTVVVGSTFCLCLLSLAGGKVAAHAPQGPQDDRSQAKALASDVLQSEEVIEALRTPLHTLSKSALNLRLPDARATSVFEPSVKVADLVASPSPVRHDVLQLDVSKWSWPVGAPSESTRVTDLSYWEGFLHSVDFFHHGKFYTVRGSFENDEKSRFRAKSGFKGLAQLCSGRLASIKAELTIVWIGDPATLGKGWRIAEIRTESFHLTETDRPLFSDVLDTALEETDRVRARRSTRDEALIQWVLNISRGNTSLDDALATIIDALGAGTYHMHMSHVCVVDIDRDGFDDIYVCPSNSMPLFFRNKGDGTFEEIAEELGLAHDQVEAAAFADFDNDGDSDAFLSFFPSETNYYRNEGGRFVQRNDLIDGPLPHLVVAISPMDYNNDGLLDVYFSRYNGVYLGIMAAAMEEARAQGRTVDPQFPGMGAQEGQELYSRLFSMSAEPFVNRPGPPNRLFKNLGNGRFAHAENVDAVEQYTQSMSATWSDIDHDGDMDIYIVTEAAPSQLVRNDGEGSFVDITDAETADVGFGMGLSWGDYDNDGWQDIYTTNMYSKAGLRIADQMKANDRILGAARGNSLMRNGPDGFKRVSGLQPPDILVEAADFGWGGAFADLNNDGNLDLYAPAGFVSMPAPVAGVGES